MFIQRTSGKSLLNCVSMALLLLGHNRQVASFLSRFVPTKHSIRSFSPTRGVVLSSQEEGQQEQPQQESVFTVTWETTATNDDNSADGTTLLSFPAHDGETLRTAALRSGVVSPHNGRANTINCRGLGTCGTCAVQINKGGKVEPAEWNTQERFRLNFPPHSAGDTNTSLLRLACQVQVRGDLSVTKFTGFWGQNEGTIAKPSKPSQPFKEWEFILDRKSPPRLPENSDD